VLTTVLWVAGLLVAIGGAVTLGWATAARLADSQEMRLERARKAAGWEVATLMKSGRSGVPVNTLVVVRKVARAGRWSQVMDQHFVGSVAWDADDYPAVLEEMQLEARTRAFQLNIGAVT
jgi:hypothetical protein